MGSDITATPADRRTSADVVYDQLREDIVSVRLLPGTKLSESDIAKQHDISRQPVREAFIRLNDLGLLNVRPQKATIVRPISKSAIHKARFVRVAVEVEVARKACQYSTPAGIQGMEALLNQQSNCLDKKDLQGFNALDHAFHKGICVVAKCDFASDVIDECKVEVGRLCMLSLANETDAKQILSDHIDIVNHLANRDEEKLVESIRAHLSRLDSTIKYVQTEHSGYFEE